MSINRNVPSPINLPVPSLDLSSCELSMKTSVSVSVIVALRSASKLLFRAVSSFFGLLTMGAAKGAAVGMGDGRDVGISVGLGVHEGFGVGTAVGQGDGAGEGIWFSALCCHVVGAGLGKHVPLTSHVGCCVGTLCQLA